MHQVLELDRTTEFHYETPIPFAALVTHMQIPIHTTKHNISESFQIHKFNSNALLHS